MGNQKIKYLKIENVWIYERLFCAFNEAPFTLWTSLCVWKMLKFWKQRKIMKLIKKISNLSKNAEYGQNTPDLIKKFENSTKLEMHLSGNISRTGKNVCL